MNSNLRLALATLLFISAVFAPPYVTAVIALALSLRWQAWEVVGAGIFMDFLWLPTSVTFTSFESIPYVTLISIIVVVGLEPLRRLLLVGPDIL